MKIAQLT